VSEKRWGRSLLFQYVRTQNEFLNPNPPPKKINYVVNVQSHSVGPLVVGADASHWPGVSRETSGAVVVSFQKVIPNIAD
jgi:hypothetical protein